MDKILYVVRHGQAEGQSPEARLTAEGTLQALALADLLAQFPICRIVASTFTRARESVEPLAQRLGISIETDERLVEAALSAVNEPDWLDRLRTTFTDLDLCFEGGESAHTGMRHAVAAVDHVLASYLGPTVLATHGRLMTLLLKHFDGTIGFAEWQALTNPDVFRVTITEQGNRVERLWK